MVITSFLTRIPRNAPRIACALALICTTSASADVVVVDAAGAGDYVGLQDGIDAAAACDIVLVRPGKYGPESFPPYDPIYIVVQRGITLVATDPEEGFGLRTELRISGVPASEPVVVGGLRQDFSGPLRGLSISDCAGPVWIDECVVDARQTSNFGTSGAVEVVDSDLAVLIDVYSLGQGSAFVPYCKVYGPSPALLAVRSTVRTLGGTYVGNGSKDQYCMGTPSTYDGAPGFPAARISSSELRMQGSTVTGARGGNGHAEYSSTPQCGAGGDGGPVFRIDPPSDPITSRVEAFHCELVPGEGGTGSGIDTFCPDGEPGEVFQLEGPLVRQVVPGTPLELQLPFIAAAGEPIAGSVSAPFSGLVFLGLANAPLAEPIDRPRIDQLILPQLGLFLGELSPEGPLEFTLNTPLLPQGARTLFAQGFAVDDAGTVHVLPAQAVVLVDPALLEG